VAERKRRGGQVASGRRAGATGGSRDDDNLLADEAADGAETEELEENLEEADADGDEAKVGSAKTDGAATKSTKTKVKATKEKTEGRPNILARMFMRLLDFVREVVAELRKVIWPTRTELLTYTSVVIVFVTLILSIVGGLDYGFARLALLVFGTTSPSGE